MENFVDDILVELEEAEKIGMDEREIVSFSECAVYWTVLCC